MAQKHHYVIADFTNKGKQIKSKLFLEIEKAQKFFDEKENGKNIVVLFKSDSHEREVIKTKGTEMIFGVYYDSKQKYFLISDKKRNS